MKKMETDVIVVAAGLSGLAAAIAAAENGARVIAFEKSQGTGGAANMGMGPFAVGSPVQRHRMVTITPGEAFRKHMFFTHYRAMPAWFVTIILNQAIRFNGSWIWVLFSKAPAGPLPLMKRPDPTQTASLPGMLFNPRMAAVQARAVPAQ